MELEHAIQLKDRIMVDNHELAKLLGLEVSWIEMYSAPKKRKEMIAQGKKPIPLVKIGKYNRYIVADVVKWLKEEFKPDYE